MANSNGKVTVPPESGLKSVLGRNIEALIQHRRAEERRQSMEDRIVSRVTRFVGSMPFVYIYSIAVLVWVAINLGWLPIPIFDPEFFRLATVTSVLAIFITTFVLINQGRMARMVDRRADLDLQISLLAEHELTRLVDLVTRMADKLDVDGPRDPDLRELTQDIAPERVLDRMEATAREIEQRVEQESV